MWRHCRRYAERMWRHCRRYAERMWRHFQRYAERMWRHCRRYAERMWRHCRRYAERMWRYRRRYAERMWRHCRRYAKRMWRHRRRCAEWMVALPQGSIVNSLKRFHWLTQVGMVKIASSLTGNGGIQLERLRSPNRSIVSMANTPLPPPLKRSLDMRSSPFIFFPLMSSGKEVRS